MVEQLRKRFESVYNQFPTDIYFAPGRINLIGEHIDYNGGYVFPCAITQGTYGAVCLREDTKIRLYSYNFETMGIVELSLSDLSYQPQHDWTNYVKGMLKYLNESGHKINQGFDIYIYGTIPNGAGLSSSASLEVLIGTMMKDLFQLDLTLLDIVKLGVKTENEYIGVSSGIMDQFAVTFGKENHALLLNTNTLEYETVPLDLKDNVIVIMNTNKRRGLSDSKYNERTQECDLALKILKSIEDKEALCDYDLETLDKHQDLFDPIIYKRAKHAITENKRTIQAKIVLEKGDLESFGMLMNQSHASLRDDYEVTGVELDTVVSIAQKQPGVIGARVTGAGFGGCALAIVKASTVQSFIRNVGKHYHDVIGYSADFYITEVGKGTYKIL